MVSEDVVVLFSGGIDSTVLLHDMARQWFNNPTALHFTGLASPHETSSASAIAGRLGVEFVTIDFSSFVQACSASYSPAPHLRGRLAYGNAVILSIALSFAISRRIPNVAVGLNGGDALAHVENRPEFIQYIRDGLKLAGAECNMLVPYQKWSKAKVLQLGKELGIDLGATFSCMTPSGGLHDGTCQSCLDRQSAFGELQISDPTLYARKASGA